VEHPFNHRWAFSARLPVVLRRVLVMLNAAVQRRQHVELPFAVGQGQSWPSVLCSKGRHGHPNFLTTNLVIRMTGTNSPTHAATAIRKTSIAVPFGSSSCSDAALGRRPQVAGVAAHGEGQRDGEAEVGHDVSPPKPGRTKRLDASHTNIIAIFKLYVNN
jgi:hypothetical protein